EQARVLELPRDLGGGAKRRESIRCLSGAMRRVPELEDDFRTVARIVDPQVERSPQPGRCLVEGEGGDGCSRGEDVVLDAALRPAEGSGGGKVVGEVGVRAPRPRRAALERLADLQMELGPPDGGETVVQGPANELVREAVGEAMGGKLLEHAAPDRLVECAEERRLRKLGRAPDHLELELRARRGSELE